MGSTLLDMTQLYYWKRVLMSTRYVNPIPSKYQRFSLEEMGPEIVLRTTFFKPSIESSRGEGEGVDEAHLISIDPFGFFLYESLNLYHSFLNL